MAGGIANPAPVDASNSPDMPTRLEALELCEAIWERLSKWLHTTPDQEALIRQCICDRVAKAGALTDEAIEYLLDGVMLCLPLTPEQVTVLNPDARDQLKEGVEHSRPVVVRRRKGHLRGPRRARWPRSKKPKAIRDYMQCGTKRVYRNHYITLDELKAWSFANCGPKKKPKAAAKGGPVGGNLADARRAIGLFDWGQPIDETQRPGTGPADVRALETAAYEKAASYAHGAGPGPDPRGISTFRRETWGTASVLGFRCREGGDTMTCDDPGSGLSRSWYKLGGGFTKDEVETFTRLHCRPRCDSPPISAGAPAGVTAKIRRVAPRNPAVKHRDRCEGGPVSLRIPAVTLLPLPALGPNPAATFTPPGCVPDQIVGGDCGIFASNWYFVIRNGVKMLVPNPELCGAVPPKVC